MTTSVKTAFPPQDDGALLKFLSDTLERKINYKIESILVSGIFGYKVIIRFSQKDENFKYIEKHIIEFDIPLDIKTSNDFLHYVLLEINSKHSTLLV